jgi:hypothetical protein
MGDVAYFLKISSVLVEDRRPETSKNPTEDWPVRGLCVELMVSS